MSNHKLGHHFTFAFFTNLIRQHCCLGHGDNVNSIWKIRFPFKLQLIEQRHYLTAKEPEQRVAHIPPMVAPGPACKHV